MLYHTLVKAYITKMRNAVSGHDVEHTVVDSQERHNEGTVTKIIDQKAEGPLGEASARTACPWPCLCHTSFENHEKVLHRKLVTTKTGRALWH